MSRPEQSADPTALVEHVHFVRALARSLLDDEHLAEDVVQDTFVRAIERPPRPWNLRGWLRVVTRNFALRRRREDTRRRHRERRTARAEAISASAQIVGRLEVHRKVVEAVLGLPEHYRAVIVHRYFDDLGRAEIARVLEVSPETVKTRLRRGLRLLRARLDGIDDGETGWCVALLCLLRRRPIHRAIRASLASAFAKYSPLYLATALGAVLVGAVCLLVLPAGEVAPRRESGAVRVPVPISTAGILVAATPATSGNGAAAVRTHPVEGVVRNARGAPIPGASLLTADDAGRAPVPTDLRGRFRLSIDGGDPLAVVVRAEGYAEWRGSLDPLHGGAYDIRLVRGVPLSVRVLAPNRTPVAGAAAAAFVVHEKGVSGMWTSVRTVPLGEGVSDAEGRVRFGNAPEGCVRIRVRGPGFASSSTHIDVVGPDPVEREIILTRGGTISGRVLDPGGRAVEGARVYLARSGRHEARTDREGLFRLELVPEGETEVFAEADGFGVGYFGSTLGWGAPVPVRVAPGQLVPGIDIQLGRALYLAGRVVDDRERAVPGVSVRGATEPRFGHDPASRTDDEGRFVAGPFRYESGARVTLSFSKAGLATRTLDAAPDAAGTLDLGDVRVARLGAARGSVLDGHGRLVSGGRVHVSPGNRAAFIAPDGTFMVPAIPPGSVHLRAEANDLRRGSRPVAVEIEPGRVTQGITLEMVPVASIRGRVVGPGGKPEPGALVGVLAVVGGSPVPGSCVRSSTGSDGSFAFEGLPEGSYVVGIAHLPRETATPGSEIPFTSGPTSVVMVLPGMRVDAGAALEQDPRPVLVEAGREEITLRLPLQGSTVNGRVVSRATGRPIGTFDVNLIRFQRFIPRQVVSAGVRDDADGAFSQALPGKGLWTAEVRAPGHATCRTPLFRSRPGETIELGTIELCAGGRMRGSVRDAHGEPVAHARIYLKSDRLQDSDRPIFTDVDGAYEAFALAPGDYSVFALSPRDPLGVVEGVEIRDRETTRVDIRLGPKSPVTLVVRDAQDLPVPGAEVIYASAEVWPLNSKLLRSYEPPGWGGWYTNEEGLLSKPCLPATRVLFFVKARGFAPVKRIVDLTAGRAERVEIRMSRKTPR